MLKVLQDQTLPAPAHPGHLPILQVCLIRTLNGLKRTARDENEIVREDKKDPSRRATGLRKISSAAGRRLLLPRTLLVAIRLQALTALVLVHL
jgi:hypothetical protein